VGDEKTTRSSHRAEQRKCADATDSSRLILAIGTLPIDTDCGTAQGCDGNPLNFSSYLNQIDASYASCTGYGPFYLRDVTSDNYLSELMRIFYMCQSTRS
jgi:hypothetical protein